jgi:polyphosphate glucokinase
MPRKHRTQSDPRILVVDIGGTHVKVVVTGLKQPMEIPSGPALTPKAMVQKVNQALTGRPYDCRLDRLSRPGGARAPSKGAV